MKLLWLDIETDGLDPNKCQILEVAVREADLLDPFTTTHLYESPVWLPRELQLDPFILDMHTKNGLLKECYGTGRPLVHEAEQKLLELVPEVVDKRERPVLAGNSVHFDHSFLTVHMPIFASRLSHQHYDVSAVKLFCRSLGMPHDKGEPAHRAMADVMMSIAEAKKCRAWLHERTVAKLF